VLTQAKGEFYQIERKNKTGVTGTGGVEPLLLAQTVGIDLRRHLDARSSGSHSFHCDDAGNVLDGPYNLVQVFFIEYLDRHLDHTNVVL
jgi:hypothetical protein